MGKVLVLGSDTRAFLAVVRSLGRRGLHVHAAWCPETTFARRSKYIEKVHDLPAYTPHGTAWKRSLIVLLQQERFDLVIPCDDPTLIPLQAHRRDLEPFGRIYLLSERAFEVTFDKIKTHEAARSLGIPVPRSVVLEAPGDPAAVVAEFRLPVVLKPRATFTAENLVNRNTVRTAATGAELRAQLVALSKGGPVLVQEHFTGTGAGVELLAWEGTVVREFQHVRVHEPLGGGGSSYRKSVPLDSELRGAAHQLMQALRYTGVAMVEFRVNFRTGKWVLIEINGRFWGSLPLAVAAGADFPYHLYELLVEGRREFPHGYDTGVYCRNWWLDGVWMRENLRAWRSHRTPTALAPWRVAGELVNALTLREHSDTLVADDPGPGMAELAYLTRAAWVRPAGRVLVRLLTWPPMRSVAARRARRAVARAQAILFVCKGNICRSPFAHRYAERALAPSVEVMSCGYYPIAGRPCTPEAVLAAREVAVDLADHRSRVISEALVRKAQVVFTFDAEDYGTVLKRYPSAKRKLHLLGTLAPTREIAIMDPFGKSIDTYRSVYTTIARALDSLAVTER